MLLAVGQIILVTFFIEVTGDMPKSLGRPAAMVPSASTLNIEIRTMGCCLTMLAGFRASVIPHSTEKASAAQNVCFLHVSAFNEV
jgi:energy-converting hydrogenase Eha subunit E